MPPDVMAEVEKAFSLWLNVEHLIAVLSGDDEGATRLTEWFVRDLERVGGSRLPLLGLRETFALVQETLGAGTAGGPVSDADRRTERLVAG
ncbi:hypothetical protein ACQP2X_16120 [Actinoplanes sp. CA-131856]